MKPLRVMFIITCFLCVFALFNSAVYALDKNFATVTVAWGRQTVYCGDTISTRVLFESNFSEPVLIHHVGLSFDWMASDIYLGHNLTLDPVTIPSYGSHLFDLMLLNIPENLTAGLHSYYVAFEGLYGESTGFSWDSLMFSVMVYESAEEAYAALLSDVSDELSEAVNVGYQSSAAQSLLGQAQTEYAEAVDLATQNNLDDALAALERASGYIDQADEEEQNSAETNSLLVLLGVIAVVVAAVLVIVWVVRKNRQKLARRKKRRAAAVS